MQPFGEFIVIMLLVYHKTERSSRNFILALFLTDKILLVLFLSKFLTYFNIEKASDTQAIYPNSSPQNSYF